jgi:hypothetical protein
MDNKNPGASRVIIVDAHGRSTIFFGSDAPAPTSAGYGVVDGSTLAKDLEPSQFGVSKKRTPDYFHIIPEVDPAAEVANVGIVVVQLVEQEGVEQFTITANQLLASAGQAMDYRIKKIFKTGTTADFSIIW